MRQPRVVVRHSPIHGRGVFANRAIAAGERIVEYRGRRVPTAEAARTDAGRTASGHTYTFALNDEWVIDGSVDGNCARWINHACEPNCEAVIDVDIDGDSRRDRVWIQALPPDPQGRGAGLRLRHRAGSAARRAAAAPVGLPLRRTELPRDHAGGPGRAAQAAR